MRLHIALALGLQSMSSPVHSFNQLPGNVPEQPPTPSIPLRDVTAGINPPSSACTPVGNNFASACSRVLGSALAFTPDDSLTRQVGQKRKYSSQRVAAPKPPARALIVKSVEAIADGSCFPPPKRELAEDEARTCCGRQCNLTFSAEADSIERVRSRVPKSGAGQQAARKVFVRSCIQDDKSLFLNDLAGVSAVVCRLFFVAVTGCSKKLISSAMDMGPPGMRERHAVNAAAQVIMAFLIDLASRWEMQPDTNAIHMAFPSKAYVYQIFAASAACQALGGICTYSYFVLMWNKHCPHIRLKKTMRFTKCDVCILATESLDQARRNGGGGWQSAAMTVIKTTLEDHYRDVTLCRGVYMAAKLRALERPDEILVIAIDGSDQSSYSVPYFRQETKDTCKGWKMRLKLIGALVTGRLCNFFTIGSNWESGSNLTIQVLHSTLVELSKTSEATGTPLPRKLHLQLDNCSRENKNRFFIGYLHLLVSLGVFDVIEMHFGLKGHTHDEIDQVFSRVGVALRQTDAATRTILGQHIVGSYKKNVSNFPVRISHLYNCGNVRDLLQDKMFSVPSVTKPQAFRISRDPADNKVKLQVQARGYENKWSAIDRTGVYREGYMEVMRPGPLPDLRDMPACPRKEVDAHTMKQHRNCFVAAQDRIRVALRLDDDVTTSFDQAMLELERAAVDLETSSPMPCDWDFAMYKLADPLDGEGGGGGEPPDGGEGGSGGGGGEPPAGDDDESEGGGGGEPPAGGDGGGGSSDDDEQAVQWQVGWFVVFPLAANNPCSLDVGQIVEVVREDEGDELVVHWYTPKRRSVPRLRSKYGKGGWSPQYTREKKSDGTTCRVPDVGRESVHAACATFPTLLAATAALPHFVWSAVEDSVPTDGVEEEEEEDEEEEEIENDEEEGGVQAQGVGGEEEDRAGRQPEESGWKAPVQSPSLVAPTRVRAPVALTAAAFRPRRVGGGAASSDGFVP